ncbi:hypothetical protein ATC03_13270 [Agromyces aureus]|uniref:Gram-positive cocci surface proteins LPxTG domain-containing protein n=1 Tax=Agromyces aureus TaxID=453304 RepID=A0A191WH38_9MICO|nr:hypothetical protein ATC03_13270 [Agromyces aureus]
MWRRAAAVLTTLALAGGLSVVAMAAPASAHTGDLKATAVCNTTTGMYDVTYTLELTQVDKNLTGSTKWRVGGSSFDGTPKSDAGMNKGPIPSQGNATLVLGTESISGTSTTGPWVYAYTTWNDKYSKGSDGRVEKLKGDCRTSNTPKLTVCHWDNGTKAYQRLELPVSSIRSGHDDHSKDIIPSYTYKTYAWWDVWETSPIINTVPAQGDQTLLQYADCVKPPTKIDVPAAPAFSDKCGPGNTVFTEPADTTELDWTTTRANGKITVSVKPQAGFAFKNGEPSITFPAYVVNDAPCPPTKIVVPAAPAFSDECGPGNTVFTEPADTTELDWTTTRANGKITVSVKPQAGFAFESGAPSITFPAFVINDTPCPIDVPAKPAFKDECGPDNTEFTEPVDTTELDWTTTRADGKITVSVKPQAGFAFKTGEASITFDPFVINDADCPPEETAAPGEPAFDDSCGPDNTVFTDPIDTDKLDWTVTRTAESITATVAPQKGLKFPAGATTSWTFKIVDTDCIPLAAAPTPTEKCGVDLDAIELPDEVEHVSWKIVGDPRSGNATAIATTDDGHFFADGTTSKSFEFTFDDEECIEPTLEGSFATGKCIADAPWIFYDVKLVDPDEQATSKKVSLVLSDGTNTETLELGELKDGVLKGQRLWPGASVAADGVTPTGWPGWEQKVDGTWQETTGNFAWTRSVTKATLVVNPEMTVDLSYPPATPNCANGPTIVPTGGGDGTTTAGGGIGLAETGFAGTGIAIVAGLIVLAGAAFLVIARVRRKNRA